MVDGPKPCMDSATLAAFADGTLDPDERRRVLAHVAGCADCTELLAEVVRTHDALELPATGPQPIQVDETAAFRARRGRAWSNRGTLGVLGGLAVAASLLMVVVLDRGSELDRLVAAAAGERPTLARPTGGFPYAPVRAALRGDPGEDNLPLLAEAARLGERAARTNAAVDLHAAGVGRLVVGDVSESITMLERAVQADPGEAEYHADLGAAYMTRFVSGGDTADAAAALDALDKALSLSPSLREAAFNRALLLERMGRRDEALDAWTNYLALTGEEGWRDEAVRHRDSLRR